MISNYDYVLNDANNLSLQAMSCKQHILICMESRGSIERDWVKERYFQFYLIIWKTLYLLRITITTAKKINKRRLRGLDYQEKNVCIEKYFDFIVLRVRFLNQGSKYFCQLRERLKTWHNRTYFQIYHFAFSQFKGAHDSDRDFRRWCCMQSLRTT